MVGVPPRKYSESHRPGYTQVLNVSSSCRWLVQNKANGVRTAVDLAGNGLRYAGQLSSAVLRVLLQVSSYLCYLCVGVCCKTICKNLETGNGSLTTYFTSAKLK